MPRGSYAAFRQRGEAPCPTSRRGEPRLTRHRPLRTDRPHPRAGRTYGGCRASRPSGEAERKPLSCFRRGIRGGPGPALGGRVGCSALLGRAYGSGHRTPETLEMVRWFTLMRRTVAGSVRSACPYCRRSLERGVLSRLSPRISVLRSTSGADATTSDAYGFGNPGEKLRCPSIRRRKVRRTKKADGGAGPISIQVAGAHARPGLIGRAQV